MDGRMSRRPTAPRLARIRRGTDRSRNRKRLQKAPRARRARPLAPFTLLKIELTPQNILNYINNLDPFSRVKSEPAPKRCEA